jgi:GR25 family glycosyltransferase involved in LPS biosynthesis
MIERYDMEINIISVVPCGSLDPAVSPFSHKHSKFIRRRWHVTQVLCPQLERLFSQSVKIRDGITPNNYTTGCTVDAQTVDWEGRQFLFSYSDEVGCFLSHYNLWLECAAGNQAMLILEDDAMLPVEHEQAVLDGVSQYNGHYANDVLYLQAASPCHPDSIKSYNPLDLSACQPSLVRLHRTNDMSGTAAYAIEPKAAANLVEWVQSRSLGGVSFTLHTALNDGTIGVILLQEPKLGFMLDDHYAPWNHIHNPTLKV